MIPPPDHGGPADTDDRADKGDKPDKGWWALGLGSLALAALSLLVLPRSVAYDPWSWLIWGREIAHLHLDTRHAATSVKPVPMLLDTLFAPAGRAAPVLWLLVARAGTLASIGLAFRLARRLGGVAAGLVAAVLLAVTDEYLGYLFMRGMSEPLAAATVLAAADSAVRRRPRATLWWLVAAGLLRPEAWPFLFLYCLWLARSGPVLRRAGLVALGVVVPASWFAIDWFGSRQLSRSADAAQHTSQGGPLLDRYPGLATFRETWHLVSGPVVVLFVVAVVVAAAGWWRHRRTPPTLWLGLAALAWLVIDAVLAQGRFATGAPRYLLPGAALAAVVVAVFVVDTARAAAARAGGRSLARMPAGALAVAAAIVVLAGVLAPRLHTTGHQVRVGDRVGRQFERLQRSLGPAVTRAGGRDRVVRCGRITTQAFQVPLVAWQLHVHLAAVGIVPAVPGTVLEQPRSPGIPPQLRSAYRDRGVVGPPDAQWTVWTTCWPHG